MIIVNILIPAFIFLFIIWAILDIGMPIISDKKPFRIIKSFFRKKKKDDKKETKHMQKNTDTEIKEEEKTVS